MCVASSEIKNYDCFLSLEEKSIPARLLFIKMKNIIQIAFC